jgi:hypothetical protein
MKFENGGIRSLACMICPQNNYLFKSETKFTYSNNNQYIIGHTAIKPITGYPQLCGYIGVTNMPKNHKTIFITKTR